MFRIGPYSIENSNGNPRRKPLCQKHESNIKYLKRLVQGKGKSYMFSQPSLSLQKLGILLKRQYSENYFAAEASRCVSGGLPKSKRALVRMMIWKKLVCKRYWKTNGRWLFSERELFLWMEILQGFLQWRAMGEDSFSSAISEGFSECSLITKVKSFTCQ